MTKDRYDVVFVSCFISSDKVQQTSFMTALWRSLRAPLLEPPAGSTLLSIEELSKKLSNRIIAIFPEVTSLQNRLILVDDSYKRTVIAEVLPSITKIVTIFIDYIRLQYQIYTFRYYSTYTVALGLPVASNKFCKTWHASTNYTSTHSWNRHSRSYDSYRTIKKRWIRSQGEN